MAGPPAAGDGHFPVQVQQPEAPDVPEGSFVGNVVNVYTRQLANQNDNLTEVFARPQDFKIRGGQAVGEACRIFYGFMLYDSKKIPELTWCYRQPTPHCVYAAAEFSVNGCSNVNNGRCATHPANRRHISTKAAFFDDRESFDPRHFLKGFRRDSHVRLFLRDPHAIKAHASTLHRGLCDTWHFSPDRLKGQRGDFFFTQQFENVFTFITTGLSFIAELEAAVSAVGESPAPDFIKNETLQLLAERKNALRNVMNSVCELQRLTKNLFTPGYAGGIPVEVTVPCAGVSYAIVHTLSPSDPKFASPILDINHPKDNNLMFVPGQEVDPPAVVVTKPTRGQQYVLPDPLKQTNLGTILQIEELYTCALVELLQTYIASMAQNNPAFMASPVGRVAGRPQTIKCYDAGFNQVQQVDHPLPNWGSFLRLVEGGTFPPLVVDGHNLGGSMAYVFIRGPLPQNAGAIEYMGFSKGLYTQQPGDLKHHMVVAYRQYREDCLKALATSMFTAPSERLQASHAYPHLQRTAGGAGITSPYHRCDGAMLHLTCTNDGRGMREGIAKDVGAYLNDQANRMDVDVMTARAIVATRCAFWGGGEAQPLDVEEEEDGEQQEDGAATDDIPPSPKV